MGSTNANRSQVIESTPLSPMTDNFNPLSSTSTGFLTNSVALYNEPLYIWNYAHIEAVTNSYIARGFGAGFVLVLVVLVLFAVARRLGGKAPG